MPTPRSSKRLVQDCERDSGRLLPFMWTKATVDDMDAIRAAMGVPTIDYLGFSYGTYLGALYAQQVSDARTRDGARRRDRTRPSRTTT